MRHLPVSLALLAAVAMTPMLAAAELPRAIAAPPIAEMTARTSVFVGHTGADAAGKAFVSGLRDAIRSSRQFRLADSESEANLVLVVVSVSPAAAGKTASAVSLAYVANNEWRSLLGSAARFVGRERAEAMGRAAVAELSAVLAAYDPAGQ